MKKYRPRLNGEEVPHFSKMTEVKAEEVGLPSVDKIKKMKARLIDVNTGATLKVISRHGGQRPGAGRKSTGRKPILIRLVPAARQRLVALAEKKQCSFSEVVEGLILH